MKLIRKESSMIRSLWIIIHFTSVINAVAQVIVEDTFSGTSIDQAKWVNLNPLTNAVIRDWRDHTVTSTTVQEVGSVRLINGASLSTLAVLNQPYRFSGVFNQTSGTTGGGRPRFILR